MSKNLLFRSTTNSFTSSDLAGFKKTARFRGMALITVTVADTNYSFSFFISGGQSHTPSSENYKYDMIGAYKTSSQTVTYSTMERVSDLNVLTITTPSDNNNRVFIYCPSGDKHNTPMSFVFRQISGDPISGELTVEILLGTTDYRTSLRTSETIEYPIISWRVFQRTFTNAQMVNGVPDDNMWTQGIGINLYQYMNIVQLTNTSTNHSFSFIVDVNEGASVNSSTGNEIRFLSVYKNSSSSLTVNPVPFVNGNVPMTNRSFISLEIRNSSGDVTTKYILCFIPSSMSRSFVRKSNNLEIHDVPIQNCRIIRVDSASGTPSIKVESFSLY